MKQWMPQQWIIYKRKKGLLMDDEESAWLTHNNYITIELHECHISSTLNRHYSINTYSSVDLTPDSESVWKMLSGTSLGST
jgi:hypothetical protein